MKRKSEVYNRKKCGDSRLSMARKSRNFRAIVIVAMMLMSSSSSRVKCKETIPNTGKIPPNIFPRQNDTFWSNVTTHNDYYLGHSGYLHATTSMLTYQTKNHTNTSTSKRPRRSKRGVTHLYNMIICATGCNPLAYKGYGCYCGFLGSGYPMDGIDRCCKMHDWCYNVAECPMFVEYFVPYYWKCYHGYKPLCAIEHGEWGGSGSCAQRLCECDRAFAECLRRYRCPRHKAVCTSSPWRLIQNLFMIV